MERVTALELEKAFFGVKELVFPAVLQDEKDLILVDCGYPGYLPYVRIAMEEKGLSLEDLTGIVITHHDYDHMGALREITRLYPQIQVYASPDQAPYITGEKRSLRVKEEPESQDVHSEEDMQAYLQEKAWSVDVSPGRVDVMVRDGDQFTWCGGAKIVATEGHMPGHISVYIPRYKTLISGDAVVVEDGKVLPPNSQYTLDMPKAMQSIEKLLHYDIQQIICFHGGIAKGNIAEQLQAILQS